MRKVSLALPVLGILLLLVMAGCGTDYQVSGRVTDTHWWMTSYPCGKHICFTTHHSFVVNGQEYQDDWDDVRTGDEVTFNYNTVWGVSNLTDDTTHHDDYTWLLGLGVVVILGAGIAYGIHRWRSADF